MPRLPLFGLATVLVLLLCATGCTTQRAPDAPKPLEQPSMYEHKTAFDGGEILFDPAGSFYHYRCADGIAMLTLWVPPGAVPVRGLFINGNPGGISGDNRQFTRDATFRAYAARLGFALMGLHSMPGNQVRLKYAATILAVLKDFAAMGQHPELANVPLITLGNSNGAGTSYAITNVAPERMVCFAMNVGGLISEPVDGALQVPGFIVIGPKDQLVGRRPGYADQYRQAIADARKRGARWAWLAEENKGHEVGRIFDYQMVFFEHCIKQRLPGLDEPGGDPRNGPVKLKELPLENGWLADDLNWASGLTPIASYAQYTGDRSIASWLPDEDLAFLYRGLSTYSSPVKLGIANLGPIINTQASGRFLTEVGGHLVDPETQLVLEADLSAFPNWSRIEFYRGGAKLGRVAPAQAGPEKPTLVTTPGNTAAAASYTLLAYGQDGTTRTAIPAHVVVRQPGLDVILAPKVRSARPQPALPAVGSGVTGLSATSVPQPANSPRLLCCWALTAEQEALFNPDGGPVSAFWAQIPVGAHLTAENASTATTQPASSDDAQLIVKAAHTRAGLYLYFEGVDDQWAEPTNDDRMLDQDAVDFLIDSRSVEEIWQEPLSKSFVNAGWSLSMTTRQFQVPFGATTPPTHIRDSYVDPFEWRAYVFPRTEVQARRGIVVKFATLSENRKAQEWFLPWPEVGAGGLVDQPRLGSSLAFTAGYNDMDPSKGGGVRQLRWNKASPWQAAPYDGRAGTWVRNDTWGELCIVGQPPR